jgi:hypothetical protein
MTRTRYKINNRGRTWYVDQENRDIAQYYSEKGATVEAEIMTDDISGIPLKKITTSELDNLYSLSDEMDWKEIKRMCREEAQQRVEQ